MYNRIVADVDDIENITLGSVQHMLVDTLNSFSLKVKSGWLNFLATMVYKIYHTTFMFTSLQLRKTINTNKKHHGLVHDAKRKLLNWT